VPDEFVGTPSDFDFLQGGVWSIRNRRLKERHVGSGDWDEFAATCRFWTLLNGVANVDEFDCPARGFMGMSVRTLDLAQRRWSIYWVNSTNGLLQPPVHGGFNNGRGEFLGEDMDGDRPILARYIWTVSPETPRWEQAFSLNRGETWETNWVMEFSRA
jgi:hypothetical protein